MSLSIVVVHAIDVAAIAASIAAAVLWYRASAAEIYRVTFHEVFDYHDLNRVIVAINRNSLRNRRAALASAIAAALLVVDLAVTRFLG